MEKQVAETPQKNDAASSLELIAILNRRKAWLVLSGFLGLALGGGYYFLSPKRYESRAELLLMQNDSEPMSASGGVERDVSEELLSTHMKLVQSSRIVKKAVMLDVEAAKTLATMEDRGGRCHRQLRDGRLGVERFNSGARHRCYHSLDNASHRTSTHRRRCPASAANGS